MRTWILFSASVIAIAIRPEINRTEVFGREVAVVWFLLLAIGLVIDIREHVKGTK